MSAIARYQHLLTEWSDVQAHLPTLYDRARGNVLELGVRHGVSTAALLAGVTAHGGHVWSVDRDDCGAVFAGHPQWTFVQADSLDCERIVPALPLDLLWIDTEHTETRTITELWTWGPLVGHGGVILLHDTDDSATYPGVRNAIDAYCKDTGLTAIFHEGSYGMGEIRC